MNRLHPTTATLSRVYFELAKLGARAVGEAAPWGFALTCCEELVVLASEFSRFDPRLFHILVDYTHHHWRDLNPLLLRRFLNKADTPQCLLVIFKFVVAASNETELHFFYDYLARGFKPLAHELYFSGLHEPGSKSMAKAALYPLEEFCAWGFLSRERPVVFSPDGRRLELGRESVVARLNLAKDLARKKGRFSLKDYLAALRGGISRQQAVLDLKNCPDFKLTGKGRGAAWRLV